MDKLWLIIRREYLVRVTRRAFILGTFLTPLGFGALIAFNVKLAMYKDDNKKQIVISDQSGVLTKAPESAGSLSFVLSRERLDVLKAEAAEKKYDGVLVIPPLQNFVNKKHVVQYYSDERLSEDMRSDVGQRLSDAIRDFKIDSMKLDTAKLNALKTRIEIDPFPLKGTEKKESSISGAVGMAIGGFMGFLMYLSVFIYGMMVMRSVMEEKISRIVEVMISSVKPFQLMLGKIIGVGAVGLTQMLIWVILITGIMFALPLFFGVHPEQAQQVAAMKAQGMDVAQNDGMRMLAELGHQDWALIVPLFLVYYLLGYLMYSSLFAAVGSAIGDDLGEAQSLTLPITIPVILALYIMFAVVRAPDSSLAVWSSMFPLFSPIVMPARLPFHPPLWQVATSVIILAATVWFFVWMTGRIYRIGILMYGKKVTIKELGKWLFYKD